MKKIVIIGGGTGTFTLLKGLREFPTENTVIVSTADDGGSGGQIRSELGVLPPGDFRQCLLGLSYTDESLKKVFAHRFIKGSLKGHTVGNILLAAAELETGSAEIGIELIGRLLNVRGSVLPVTLKPTVLSAKLDNGKTLKGEHIIDEPQVKQSYKIESLSLSPSGPANPKALKAISEADAIVFGPGDLFTSVIPSLLVKGVKEAIVKSPAQKIAITNIMTKFGQTEGYTASEFLSQLHKYLGEGSSVTRVIVNTQEPDAENLKLYKKEKAGFVVPDIDVLKSMGVEVLSAKLISREKFKKSKADTLKRSVLRHDSDKLAQLIWKSL